MKDSEEFSLFGCCLNLSIQTQALASLSFWRIGKKNEELMKKDSILIKAYIFPV
ncbi:MAG: hypothetical protein N4J56_001132 [Chroococcidiopsis sp. SAG 2025]|nr:hypothetical protein [Chroococcidiopsis sp. SAG 2025]